MIEQRIMDLSCGGVSKIQSCVITNPKKGVEEREFLWYGYRKQVLMVRAGVTPVD